MIISRKGTTCYEITSKQFIKAYINGELNERLLINKVNRLRNLRRQYKQKILRISVRLAMRDWNLNRDSERMEIFYLKKTLTAVTTKFEPEIQKLT